MPYKVPTVVTQAFEARGWIRGAGGDLYFNGLQNTSHPHLHLKIEGRGTVKASTPQDPGDGDIRAAIKMLAWSDGQQHAGGGGRLLIRVGGVGFVQGTVALNQQNTDFVFADVQINENNFSVLMAGQGSQAMKDEMSWARSYFTDQ